MPIDMSIVIAIVLFFVAAYLFIIFKVNKRSGKARKSGFKANQIMQNVGEQRK